MNFSGGCRGVSRSFWDASHASRGAEGGGCSKAFQEVLEGLHSFSGEFTPEPLAVVQRCFMSQALR